MVKYYIYDRKIAYSKGLNKAFLRVVPTKKLADIYTNKQNDYIVKKVKEKRIKKEDFS